MEGKVLVVDDDQSNLLLLSYAFKSDAFQIYGALSGKEAVVLANENVFDLAFIDVELPDISGLVLAEVLRKRMPSAVLAMSTAIHNYEAMERACQAGANMYIIKPFNIITVVKYIKDATSESLRPADQMIVIDNRSNIRPYRCGEYSTP